MSIRKARGEHGCDPGREGVSTLKAGAQAHPQEVPAWMMEDGRPCG